MTTVLRAVRSATGVDLEVLSGAEEARLTFLAVRRWFGWSSGRLLVLDIGGGSLEVGVGNTEEPDAAFSLPLGAGRLTREFLTGDPPAAGGGEAPAQARAAAARRAAARFWTSPVARHTSSARRRPSNSWPG